MSIAGLMDCSLRMRRLFTPLYHSGDYEVATSSTPCNRRNSRWLMHTDGRQSYRNIYRSQSTHKPTDNRRFRRCRNPGSNFAPFAESHHEMTCAEKGGLLCLQSAFDFPFRNWNHSNPSIEPLHSERRFWRG